ncbi:MAG: ABC transporter ATP-binding protein [Vallitaleaceae bacterium]|nr:ABC transporter ATP-binding protein [Vallitaleaceae bacterium]
MNDIIRLQGISKSFGETKVLNSIDLSVRKNEFLTLLGPSGCGKTTTLRIIGGFENPDSGQVYFENQEITNLPPYRRNINTVFQKYALFTHLNVRDNIAFGLKLKKLSKGEIEKKVDWALELINLKGYGNRSTQALSGGQQQRIAIARAIVNEPDILLLDEPLGALDLKLRQDMQYELKELQHQLGITFIYVTHDQEEALTMSNTVVVMNNGIIQQQGTPESIYNEPINSFVADFIGESNILPGIMLHDELVEIMGKKYPCVDKGFNLKEEVEVVFRPEDLLVVDYNPDLLSGVVTDCIFKGVHYESCIMVDHKEFVVHNTKSHAPGKQVSIAIIPDNIHIMKKGAVL